MESEIDTLYNQLSLKQRKHIKEYIIQCITREQLYNDIKNNYLSIY